MLLITSPRCRLRASPITLSLCVRDLMTRCVYRVASRVGENEEPGLPLKPIGSAHGQSYQVIMQGGKYVCGLRKLLVGLELAFHVPYIPRSLTLVRTGCDRMLRMRGMVTRRRRAGAQKHTCSHTGPSLSRPLRHHLAQQCIMCGHVRSEGAVRGGLGPAVHPPAQRCVVARRGCQRAPGR